MKKSSVISIIILAIIILFIIVGMLAFDIGRHQPASYESIASFQDCLTAGYPITQSNPQQCVLPDGTSFTGTVASTTTEIATSTSTTTPKNSGTASTTSDVIISSPHANSTITSPLTITGKAQSSWFFEAQFPIEIHDSQGNVLGQGIAHATSDWTQPGLIPFTALIQFVSSSTATGTIQFKNDNPSGDPSRDKFVIIPISFSH